MGKTMEIIKESIFILRSIFFIPHLMLFYCQAAKV